MNLTAVFMECPQGYIAFVEELPDANTQGVTLEEARENLREAVQLVLGSQPRDGREVRFVGWVSRLQAAQPTRVLPRQNSVGCAA